jgi:hypothetical protein
MLPRGFFERVQEAILNRARAQASVRRLSTVTNSDRPESLPNSETSRDAKQAWVADSLTVSASMRMAPHGRSASDKTGALDND